MNFVACAMPFCYEHIPNLLTYQQSLPFLPHRNTYVHCVVYYCVPQRGKLLGELYQYWTNAQAYPFSPASDQPPHPHHLHMWTRKDKNKRQQKPLLNYGDVFIEITFRKTIFTCLVNVSRLSWSNLEVLLSTIVLEDACIKVKNWVRMLSTYVTKDVWRFSRVQTVPFLKFAIRWDMQLIKHR